MNQILKTFIAGAALTLAASASAGVLVSQPYDGTGNLLASQNDTTGGGFGVFAAAYDDFTLTSTEDLTGLDVTGGYFNPGAPGNITAFTVTLYADAGGSPGGVVWTNVFPGNGNETLLSGNIDTYSFNLGNVPLAAGTYWLSVVPDQAFPPQWGWATSATGDGDGYQCFFGTCGGAGVNFAFDLTGGVPEPATWALMLIGFAGLGAALRSRRGRQAGQAA